MRTSLYGGIIKLGPDAQPIMPDLVLAYRSGEKQGVIQNVQAFTHSNRMMAASEISFNVHKGSEENRCLLWDEIRDFKMVYIPQLALNGFNPWYEIEVTIDEGDETIKHCQGVHAQEAELSQLTLNEFEANTEDDIARDDYVPTVLYNPDNPEGSLLHRMLRDKASHYSINHVDGSIASKQRTFSWNGTSIIDAFNNIATELECLFVYGESAEDDGQIHRTVSVYDLKDYCLDCGARGSFEDGVCPKCGSTSVRQGYGEDTGIFITYENYADNLNYTSNKDSIKNCFRLVAGDDLMTATVINLNPSGSQYIWYLSESMRADMSHELRSKLADYDALHEEYEQSKAFDIPESAIDAYNDLVDKYKEYDDELERYEYPITGYNKLIELYYNALNFYNLLKTSLAPMSEYGRPTSAQEQIRTLNAQNLSPLGVTNAATISATTVNSVLLNYAKVYIDTSLYKVSIDESDYSDRTWTGRLRLTSYDDEEDTATTSALVISITDAEPEYLRCQIDKAMKKAENDATTMVALFDKDDDIFKEELHHYSVDNLSMLANLARGCLDVLIQHGQGSPEAHMYQSMYLKYYNKSEYIQSELKDRESEVETLRMSQQTTKGILDYIEDARRGVMAALDLRTYLGEQLWSEFCSFRRDETYQNENFISDGLTDTELVAMAQEFLDYARTEIIKSATPQHTISCDLNDFLLVREQDVLDAESSIVTHAGIRLVTESGRFLVKQEAELSPLNNKFTVGNWLHVEIDGIVYKLRMTEYEINYDDLSSIMVEFSDASYVTGPSDDLRSVLSRAQSMSTSYNTTQRQANKGNIASEQIAGMVSNGLDLTNKRIVNSAAAQTLLVDDTGMLMRAKNDYDDEFNAEQVKIINHGLYYTSDNWRTVQAGIGKFAYYDPEAGAVMEDYGLIARKIVGNIIIGNDLGIYTQNGSMTMDEDGFTITTDAEDVNQRLFTLQRKNSDGSYTKYVYVGNDGRIEIDGDIIATGTISTDKIAANAITSDKIAANTITAGNIAAGTITADEIAAGTITSEKIAANTITASNIAAGTITSDEIAAGAIKATNIEASAITSEKIAANAVVSDKIAANAIIAGKIAANAVASENILAEAITAGKIASSAITADKIAANAVTAGKIAANAVTADSIAANAVTADSIAANAVTAGKIAANAVTADSIAANAITSGKIAAGAITASMITSGTMSADRISGGTIDANNVTINNLNASKIVSGTISDKNSTNSWNLDTGYLNTQSGKIGNFTLSGGILSYNDTSASTKPSVNLSADGLKVSAYDNLATTTLKTVVVHEGLIAFTANDSTVASFDVNVNNGYGFRARYGDTLIFSATSFGNRFNGSAVSADSATSDSDGNTINSTYLKRSDMHIKSVTATTSTNGNVNLSIRSPAYSGTKYVVISAWCTSGNYICHPYRYNNYWYCNVISGTTPLASTEVTIQAAYIPMDRFATD